MEFLLDRHWHHIDPAEIAGLLDVDPEKGLDILEAQRRLELFGANRLTGKRGKTNLERFMRQFHQPLVYILIISCFITAALGEWVDAGVILGVVLVNSIVGYFQEAKAVKALAALSASMTTDATVLRGGKTIRIDAALLTPGDIVILRSGDKVPADVRLVQSKELRIDESALTGESLPVEKDPGLVAKDAVLAERTCMAYAGTLVAYGQGHGLVIATGNKTELGRISNLIDTAEELETPLTRKIARFSHILLIAILALAIATFIIGVMRNEPVADMFIAAVALAVGAIPEGLPAAVTIILAIGVSRMAARKAVVRQLPAVETLGSVTVICSDKTGTLTENQMTVQEIYAGGTYATVTGAGYGLSGEVHPADGNRENIALAECLRAGLLCNDAGFSTVENRPKVEGDPTEAALLVSAAKFGLNREDEKRRFPRTDEVSFESERQYMATLHANGNEMVAFLKGSAERTLECCDSVLAPDGNVLPLDKAAVLGVVDALALKGMRVLALAKKEFSSPKNNLDHADIASGMVFLGLQGMIDPPRPEAIQAVAACRKAGIRVKMITGDHAGTAVAIGRQLGLGARTCPDDTACMALTGQELAGFSDEELIEKATQTDIFARVSPEQKLRLVMALQADGQVTAMTGDGVNDAPALKRANIGVAMGQAGTDAAKEAADIVLTDDNFATIEAAIEEGRGVFDNLIKFIAWTLPTNIGEGLVILAAFVFGVALPILPVQILWINMTTAGCLGLMLAFEPKEPGIMDRPPRDPRKPILGTYLIGRITLVGILLVIAAFGLFKWTLSSGASIEVARTVAVNVFVMVEAVYLYNTRSFAQSPFALGFFSNPWISVGAGIMIVLQLLYTYLPVMNKLFGSAPIDGLEWLKIALVALVVFGIVEFEKKLRGKATV